MSAPSKRRPPAGTAAWTVVGSPVGDLLLAAGPSGVHLVCFLDAGRKERELAALARRGVEPVELDDAPGGVVHHVRRTRSQLAQYFAGERKTFDLPLRPLGTPFQEKVWLTLAMIPYGETRSYADLARAVGNPRASRAVGAANGKNPLPVILPCHRVVGADGSLTGFGGGLPRKRWLLAHEARHAARPALFEPDEGTPARGRQLTT